MYLKSIEIHGFKSFANKILFDFHNGITGIVGPNGSGKSNVADAVRWVLGEQRVKQLRGGSMQDVIFAGTELRKPQGFASVAITLDNSDHQLAIDYDEVTVTRRLYRSGESEYRINGSTCRLKDINELFYDTGIGKEGYSIIGQGQIDKILSGKPEERRELFDEAAGIVKFKRRKAIAQKKLDDEQQNLVRVSDILSELEKQVGPLARQSETAKKYLAYRDELKVYDVNLFLMESEQIRGQLKDVESRSEIVSSDLNEANAQAEELKAEYDRLEEVLTGLDQTLNEKRTLYSQAEVLGGNLEGQINVLNEQINTEHLRAEHIHERTNTLTEEIRRKKEQITGYQTESRQITEASNESRRKKIAAEYALEQDEAAIQSLEQQAEEAKSNVLSGMNSKADLSAKAERYGTMLEQVQVRRSEVLQKLLKFKSDESAQDEEIQSEKKKLEQVEERLNALAQRQTEAEGEYENLDLEVYRLNRSLNAKQQEYHTTNTRMESLRNLAERYEGYGNSTRRVMEMKDRIRGIHGVVADLVATDKRYETAIETALGGSIQNVVTDTEQTAKQLIEYLKKNKFGRVTFLPLTSISQSGGFNRPEVLKEQGVVGLGSDLVTVAPEYKVLAQYLLGRVIVADTIDHAIALAKKYKYTLRIVTLEGELLNAGGSMTGGAFKNNSNLLGRKRELEDLEKICTKVQQEIQKLQEELKLRQGLFTEKKEELERIRKELHQVSLSQNTLRMSVNQMDEKRAEIQNSYQDLMKESSQMERQIHEIEAEQKRVQSDTSALAQQSEQVNAVIAKLNQQIDEAKQAKEQSAKKLEEINLEIANLRQREDFILENIHRVEEETARLEEELNGLSGGAGDSDQIIQEKQAEILRLKELIVHASEEKQKLSEELNGLSAKKDETSKEQKSFFVRREELTERISRLDKDLFRLQNQKEKLDEKLEHQINYMWNEYELTLTTAAPLRSPELTVLSEIRKRIDELKTAIRGLGNVNVNAIEDYKEVAERYEFMKTQHDDLIEAEGVLVKIIEELDEGMRRQFAEKFQEIRKEFDRVFKELFGGGHGALELMEDVDILEAGIQIIAQPPGKKLQNMMQLSGGEKALTAIALLFAIQNLKPSPFCLLDEIEAALDDSNVDRFAGYLHKLTKNTQFIVITHRRGTMISADRLYGITMQEKGVSTLVSVNLIEDQLDE